MSINKENETIKYYKGIIRNLDATVKVLSSRIKKLEEKVRKISRTSPQNPTNLDVFSDIAEDKGHGSTTYVGGGSGGGLTASEIKTLVAGWISNGELPISLHDHTDTTKGGDAYANKGAALQ